MIRTMQGVQHQWKCSCNAQIPCRSLYYLSALLLAFMQFFLQWAMPIILLWPTVPRLPAPLVQKAEISGLYVPTTTTPTLLLHIQSFKSNIQCSKIKGQLTYLSSGQTLRYNLNYRVFLRHQAQGILQKLYPCVASSHFFSHFPHFLSGFSREHFPWIRGKHCIVSSHSTSYSYFILINSWAITCSKSIFSISI